MNEMCGQQQSRHIHTKLYGSKEELEKMAKSSHTRTKSTAARKNCRRWPQSSYTPNSHCSECACVCACVRTCVRVCAYVRVCVCGACMRACGFLARKNCRRKNWRRWPQSSYTPNSTVARRNCRRQLHSSVSQTGP